MNNFEAKEIDLDTKVKTYVNQYKPTICILTPCYGSMCYVNYVYCLIKTKEVFELYGIGLKIEFCKNDSLVSRARNNLVAKAMAMPNITHIMFIDNDITWDPINIIKLMIADKPIVGGIYPLKKYNWEKIAQNKNFVTDIIKRKNE